MKPSAIVSALALCAFPAVVLPAQNVNWKDYLGGPESSHYSPLTQINVTNVNKIQIAWTYAAGDSNSVVCPLVVDRVAYVVNKGGALVAIERASGSVSDTCWSAAS